MIRNILINSIVSFGLIIGAMTGLSHATMTTHTENSCAVWTQSWSNTPQELNEYTAITPFGGSVIISHSATYVFAFTQDFDGDLVLTGQRYAISNAFDPVTKTWKDIELSYTRRFTGPFQAGDTVTLNPTGAYGAADQIVGVSDILDIAEGTPGFILATEIKVNDNATAAQSGICLH